VAGADWEGFTGVLHGGVIGTLLDEAMAKAVVAREWRGMTVELRVRYRHHVATGEELRISGWVTERKKRRVLVEASVSTVNGEERAHGWGTFLLVDR
jgi:acyl-coenzyme A thioesterase PaaI-like protein